MNDAQNDEQKDALKFPTRGQVKSRNGKLRPMSASPAPYPDDHLWQAANNFLRATFSMISCYYRNLQTMSR